MKPAWTAIKTKARKRRFSRCSGNSHFYYWHKLDSQRVFKSQAMPDASFEAGQSNDGTAGQLTASSHGTWYMYDQRGNLSMQGQTSTVDNGFAEYEKNTHYYWLPNEFGDILVALDQDGQSYAVYTDHINTPRLVTLVNNPLNPVPLSDTSNDLAQTSGDAIQGISPLAMPVWQMAYSAFGVDLVNGYEARPTTINNNFKPDLWEWLGLPTIGGAGNWSWYAGGGNGQANSSVLTAPMLNIRYPGQYYDFESGLSQNWWRSYDARMGRYTQNDPIGLEGGLNRFGYVGGDGINYSDSMGLRTGVTIWQPVGWGSSSFGHVSTTINGTTYSYGPGGMSTMPQVDYLSRNGFREGTEVDLNLTPEQEAELADCFAKPQGDYNAATNNCGTPIQRCLAEVGVNDAYARGQSTIGINGRHVLPVDLGDGLLSSGAFKGITRYPASRPAGGFSAPWAR